MEGDAKDYAGKLSKSRTRDCMNWTTLYESYDDEMREEGYEGMRESITDDNFPEKSVFNALNYCRSPNSDSRPWCASDWYGRFKVEYCEIPRCEGNV